MIKLIEPQSHHMHRAKIDSFLDLLQQHQNVRLSPELRDKSTFLIASAEALSPSGSKPEGEIYGGAVFYPQKISSSFDLSAKDNLEETLGKLFSALQPHGQTYWIARIGLFRDHDLSIPPMEKLERCHKFYQQLYKAFLKFGKTKKVKALAFTLRSFATFDINTYKYWPGLVEVQLPGSLDGYFYGLLPSKKQSFMPRRKEDMFISFQPFAEEKRSSLIPSHPEFQRRV
ncbi:MAG: hypothetical protein H0X26_10440 [Alphaproteobacteria bacterium]|nr:hypothetical protein [Alphaproteobacteria bacterium]